MTARIPEWATEAAWVEFCHGGRKWRALVSPANHMEEPDADIADAQRKAAAEHVVKTLNGAPSCRDRIEQFDESCVKCSPVKEST